MLFPVTIITLLSGCGSKQDTQGERRQLSLLHLLDHAETRSSVKHGIRAKWIRVGPETRPCIFAHPESKVTFHGFTARSDVVLTFGIGMMNTSWGCEGDGMTFRILAGQSDRVDTLFSRYIDPKHNYRDRKWHDFTVPLEVTEDLDFSLTFETDPGPADDFMFDWGGWSTPRLEGTIRYPPVHGPIAAAANSGCNTVSGVADKENGDRTSKDIDREFSSPSKPNILLLLVDTLRADHLGCYGYERMTAPALDQFAKQSILFEDVLSVSSWTIPAVASLFTGVHPYQHGVITDEACYLDDAFCTLAEFLQRRGFSTAAFVTNPLVSRDQNFDQGFEDFYFFDRLDARGMNEFFLSWLENHREHRFFAYLHYMDPHDPYTAPGKFYDYFDPSYEGPFDGHSINTLWRCINFEKEVCDYTMTDIAHLAALYDGEIRFWDHHFFTLLAHLTETGLLEKTVLLVTSDHGEEFMEHGKVKHGAQLYDETVHVPLILHIPRGKEYRDPVPAQTTDIYPTLLATLSYDIPPFLEGRALLEKERDVHEGSTTLQRYRYGQTSRAYLPAFDRNTHTEMVHCGQWKLICTPELHKVELYDTAADPAERIDISDEYPQVVQVLEERLEGWKNLPSPVSGIAQGSKKAETTDIRDALRSLGYIE
jgi:arylsulfatase A-like enzyme